MPETPVQRRTRKLIGTTLMIALVILWALAAMAIAQGRIQEAARVWQMAYYIFAGLGWVVPAGLLIRWMERPDRSADV
jgi:magnesium-transporting ATPase (P-type)